MYQIIYRYINIMLFLSFIMLAFGADYGYGKWAAQETIARGQ